MGKFSRDKGARVEREFVKHLKSMGHEDALRVPLSGASEGFKGDVVCDSLGLTFEIKARKSEFKQIYRLANTLSMMPYDAIMYEGVRLSVTKDFEAVLEETPIVWTNPSGLSRRTLGKVLRMRSLLGEADILVLKGDREEFLYIKYA